MISRTRQSPNVKAKTPKPRAFCPIWRGRPEKGASGFQVRLPWVEEAPVMTRLIGMRVKALREGRKLPQDDLARLFGFKDRQTVSAIETGARRGGSMPGSCARRWWRSIPSVSARNWRFGRTASYWTGRGVAPGSRASSGQRLGSVRAGQGQPPFRGPDGVPRTARVFGAPPR